MKGRVPKVLRSVVLGFLEAILTGVVVWLLCLLLSISFLLGAMEPFLSEVAASTLVGLPMVIKVPFP